MIRQLIQPETAQPKVQIITVMDLMPREACQEKQNVGWQLAHQESGHPWLEQAVMESITSVIGTKSIQLDHHNVILVQGLLIVLIMTLKMPV